MTVPAPDKTRRVAAAPASAAVPDANGFCRKVTQAKMLALHPDLNLKKTFIEPLEAGGVALLDRILSMEDGFECLLKNRNDPKAFHGLGQIYDLCTGRIFSPTFETDGDIVVNLAKVRLPHSCLQ